VASRVLVGLTEAAIMTCCTTLLADYFDGSQRDRYFGLQVVFTTAAATLFFGLGGALGAENWRTPFWLYAVSLPLAYLAARHIWQPAPQARTGKLPALPWRQLAAPVGVTLLGGLVFYVLIVELSFKLDDIGIDSPATIGASARSPRSGPPSALSCSAAWRSSARRPSCRSPSACPAWD